MDIRGTFATNVRKYRKAAHLSQEKLAELSGLHRTYIGGIEQRRVNISLKNVGRIAEALHVDPALLFFDMEAASGEANAHTAGPGPAPQGSSIASKLADMPGDHAETGYALVAWTGNEVEVKPIAVRHEDITVQILCNLVRAGYEGDDLAAQYDCVSAEVLAFLSR